MLRNLVFLDPAGVWQLPFEGPTLTLGRDDGNDVKLEDLQVSRRHAALQLRDDGAVWVVDLDSRNGVFRNGIRVPGSSPLVHRDVLAIGRAKIRFLETAGHSSHAQLSFSWPDLVDMQPPRMAAAPR
jgi:pSer/pThr/pTyr-binding forkhead associated (FHA) protein